MDTDKNSMDSYQNDQQIKQVAEDKKVSRWRLRERKDQIQVENYSRMKKPELMNMIKEDSDRLYLEGERETVETSEERKMVNEVILKITPNLEGTNMQIIHTDGSSSGFNQDSEEEMNKSIPPNQIRLDSMHCSLMAGKLGECDEYHFLASHLYSYINSMESKIIEALRSYMEPMLCIPQRKTEKLEDIDIDGFSVTLAHKILGASSIRDKILKDNAVYLIHYVYNGIFIVNVYCKKDVLDYHYFWQGYFFIGH